MTLTEIKQIIERANYLRNADEDKLIEVFKMILASHLRSQIELLNRVISSENSERILDKKEDEISKLQTELKTLNQ